MDRVYALDPRGRPSDLHSVVIETAHLPDRSVHGNLVPRSSRQRDDPGIIRRQGPRAEQLGVPRGDELADEWTVDSDQRVPVGR